MRSREDIQKRVLARLLAQRKEAEKNQIDFDCNPFDIAQELLGYPGAMYSGSKQAPDEKRVVWNANVFANKMKIWHGDLSITDKADKLQELANKLGVKIYVLREMDGRFDHESDPLLDRAVEVFEPQS